MLHRNHGWRRGWYRPLFTIDDLPSLDNGDLLPVVFSVNCSSGIFDSTKLSWAEAILRMDGGGAVAILGDT